MGCKNEHALQGGNLISLKPRGSAARGSDGNTAGEWEQWPDEGGASSSRHGNEDDDLQRAIAASLADPEQGASLTLLRRLRDCWHAQRQ